MKAVTRAILSVTLGESMPNLISCRVDDIVVRRQHSAFEWDMVLALPSEPSGARDLMKLGVDIGKRISRCGNL